jgi:hypothetical protein
MKKNIYTLLLFSFVILFNSCYEINHDCTIGSRNIIYDTRVLPGFYSIVLEGTGNLFITQEQSDSLIIETDDNIAPIIKTSVRDSMLYIKPSDQICPTKLNISAYMEKIKYLNLSGSGNIVSADTLNLEDVDIEIDGSGNINLFGSAHKVTAGLDGSGNIELLDMAADSAYIVINGSGNIKVNASKYLKAIINGSGNIYYKGNPIVKEIQINGSGNVINLP